MGVAYFRACASKIFASHAMACALKLNVSISWAKASGMILDCCRYVTGVPRTKVLHSFNEAQILIW